MDATIGSRRRAEHPQSSVMGTWLRSSSSFVRTGHNQRRTPDIAASAPSAPHARDTHIDHPRAIIRTGGQLTAQLLHTGAMHGQPTPRPLLRGQAILRVGIVTDIVGLANLNPFGRQGDEQQVGIISRRCMAADIRADLRHQRQRLGRRLGVHDHDDAVDRGRPPDSPAPPETPRYR